MQHGHIKFVLLCTRWISAQTQQNNYGFYNNLVLCAVHLNFEMEFVLSFLYDYIQILQ